MNFFIPTPLRPYIYGEDATDLSVATIAEALDLLTRTYLSFASISSPTRESFAPLSISI